MTSFDLLGDLLELVGLGVGVLERGARRRLEDGVDDALVLARDETSRELRVDDDDAGGKAPDDGHGQRAAGDDPPQDPGIAARDLLDGAVERTPHEGQEDEQEADRPPQLIRQISDRAQDQQPAEHIQQLDPQSARPFHVLVSVSAVCVSGRCRSCGVVRCGCGA